MHGYLTEKLATRSFVQRAADDFFICTEISWWLLHLHRDQLTTPAFVPRSAIDSFICTEISWRLLHLYRDQLTAPSFTSSLHFPFICDLIFSSNFLFFSKFLNLSQNVKFNFAKIHISDINYEIADLTVSCFADDTRILLGIKVEEDT